jgi:RNA polymerase sigma factor (sigma-70 family)
MSTRCRRGCILPTISSEPGVKEIMAEVAGYEIIGHRAESVCFHAYHTSDDEGIREAAKLRIIKSNLRLVLKFAMDYHNVTGLPVTDFYTEGKLGLLESFYKYDYRTGVKFASFAIWEIRRHMSMVVQGRDLIHVPVRQRKRVLKAIRDGLPMNMNYGPEAKNAIMGPDSLDRPVGEDGEESSFLLHEVVPDEREDANPEKSTINEELRNGLDEELKRVLAPTENRLIRSLYGLDGEGSSFEDEAANTGMSKDWVRKVKSQAIEKLRDSNRLGVLRSLYT